MTSVGVPSRRVTWFERLPRRSHDVVFTVAGGRRRRDELGELQGPAAEIAARYVSQVAITLPRVPERRADDDVSYWVTVCRKILQRGARPPLSKRVDDLLPPVPPTLSSDAVLRAVQTTPEASDVDGSYDLHPQWERPYWDRAHLVSPRASAWLIPQASLEGLVAGKIDPSVGRHWADFLYAPPGTRPVVLEIDGSGHVRREDVDRARDRQLGEAGIQVIRAKGNDCLDPTGPLLKRLLDDEARFPDRPAEADSLLASSVPHRLALAVVEAVELGLLAKGGPWSMEVVDPIGVVDEIVGPALDSLRAVSELWRLDVVPRSVQVNGREWRLSGEAGHNERSSTRLSPTVRIRLEPRTQYFAPLSAAADVPEITVRSAGVPVDLTWLPGTTSARRSMRATEDSRLHLTLLMQDLFGHEDFREGQLPSLEQALRGGDSVVLLPTGTGKSLIYQLAGLLMPGTTVVIDPLVSLIDDQEGRLVRDGIDRVSAVHASRAGGTRERDLALEALSRGEPLFLFVTPERFQNQRFRDNLRESARHQLVNLAVIDEAHTVSEWGHDFRTSYLRLARNVRRLCGDDDGGWPPVLALTGTAGPAVLRDVLRELEIDAEADGALQRPISHDRPNLHYRKLRGDDAGWQELVRRALTDLVPRSLETDPAALAELQGASTLSGIVFCQWAGGGHGVDRIRDDIVQTFAAAGVQLRADTYSGKSSTVADRRVWADQKAKAAADFKANAVPMLVATKAFGMGIDKPNIRYTVHAGFPSSIEAFAQEAGRAGRDGQDAYCVLTVALPDEDTAAWLLDRSISPAERRIRVDSRRANAGGDLRRQLFFYGNSFPGAEEEASLGMRLYRWLVDKGGGPGQQAVIPIPQKRDEKPVGYESRKAKYDRALFRLASLGVVDDLTIDSPVYTVHFAAYDKASVDEALLVYLSRIEPGNEQTHREVLEAAPQPFEDRLAAHLRTLADAVYGIVAAARLTAIENMYDLARGSDDPGHLRGRINAYLGDGVAATILAEAVAMSPIDVPRFVAMLETLQAIENDSLSGATARIQEAYPDHPLLWLASAYSTAREPAGDERRFATSLRRSLKTLDAYNVERAQAAEGVRWLMHRLRTENGGARWDWAAGVFETWDDAGFGLELLEAAEDQALLLAKEGRYRERELSTVIRRRMQRRANEVGVLADTYAATSPADRGSAE